MDKYFYAIMSLLCVLNKAIKSKMGKALLDELHDVVLCLKEEGNDWRDKANLYGNLLQHEVLVNLVFGEYTGRRVTFSDKLACIKMLREVKGMSLKEAKELCDTVFGSREQYREFRQGQSVYLTYMPLHKALQMACAAEKQEDLAFTVTIEMDDSDLPSVPASIS